jgi:16S rRNA (guanine527-N7)-methyltransferase
LKQIIMISPIELTDDQERRLRELMEVFLEENQKLNLSAYREEEACWIGNVLDSVAAAMTTKGPHAEEAPATPFETHDAKHRAPQGDVHVIDIGTGGGFPLLPLALLLPDVHFTGLDATKKKIAAVQRIADKLGIENVTLLTGRAEEIGQDSRYREQYDVVLSRAVAPLATLLELMSPFAKVKGTMICWKTLSIEKEMQDSLNARLALQSRLMDRVEYELPEGWGRRQLLLFEKTGSLSPEYPRGVGVPKKSPL